MLLRRIIEHVKAQNWTAIALDFVIVVSGVFIGIQVANFNDLQNERRDYELALERYRQEIAVNLNSLKELETASAEKNAFVTSAYDVLLSCDETPENRAIVEKGLYEIRITIGIDLVTTALEELTENQTLLKNQTEEIRQSLKQSRKRIERLMLEADVAERMPFMEGYYENPIIAISASNERTVTVADSEISMPSRTLTLAVPLNEACEDNMLKKSFYTWERMQTLVPVFSAWLREIYEKDLELIQ